MKKSTLILFLAAFALAACKKDQIEAPPVEVEEPVETPDCVPLKIQKPSSGGILNQYFLPVIPEFRHVDINPNNPDEIVLHYWDGNAEFRRTLARYNLKTKEKYILLETPSDGLLAVSTCPGWGNNDWIIFGGQPGNLQWDIFKIKSNGDSLTRLTFRSNIHLPVWNWKGNKFLCYPGLNSPNISLIFNEYGTKEDTIWGGFRAGGQGSWRHPNGLLAFYSPGKKSLLINNPEKDTLVLSIPIPIETRSAISGGAIWIDEEHVVWSYEPGVFRTNILTGESVQLISSCDAIIYLYPGYSEALKKVLFLRQKRTYNPEGRFVHYGVGFGFYDGWLETDLIFVDPFDGTMEVVEMDGL
jgi:hypothetical protein